MRVRAILTGHKEAMASLRALEAAGPIAVRDVLARNSDEVVRLAQAACPRKTGRAARTIKRTRGTATAEGRFSTAVVGGGPAAPYFERLHEDLTLQLRNGEHKFIEKPWLRIAERTPDDLMRAADLHLARTPKAVAA